MASIVHLSLELCTMSFSLGQFTGRTGEQVPKLRKPVMTVQTDKRLHQPVLNGRTVLHTIMKVHAHVYPNKYLPRI